MKRNILLLSLIFLFFNGQPVVSTQNEIAFILKNRGLVSVSYLNDSKNSVVSRGYLLYPGAILQTGASGFAVIRYIGSHSITIIRPRSQVVISSFTEDDQTTESMELKAGEVFLETKQPRKHSFDLYTTNALIALGETKCLAIMSRYDGGTALYNISGSLKIADNNFNSWREIPPSTAAYSGKNNFVHISPITDVSLPKLHDIYNSSANLEPGPALVQNVTIVNNFNGTVEPQGKLIVLNGVTISIKAVPEDAYTFTGWEVVNGNVLLKDATAAETQLAVMSDATIKAGFAEKPAVLHIYKSKEGIIEPSGKIFVQPKIPVLIKVAPHQGFEFAGWKTANNIKIKEISPFQSAITLDSEQGKIKAQFVRKTYTLAIQESKHGTAIPNKQLTVNHGDTTKLLATPHQGQQFIEWEIVQGFPKIADIRQRSTEIICDSTDATIRPIFSDKYVEVSILGHDAAIIDPMGNFYVIRNSLFSVHATPNEGLDLKKWLVERGRARIKGLTKATIKCKTPFEIKPVIASKEYSLTLLGDNLGTVIPPKPQIVLHQQPFTIVAKPHGDKHFIRWKLSGGWAEIANAQKDSTQVTLSQSNAVIQAEFAETICTLAIASTKGGYTEPAGKFKNYNGGSLVLQAVPNPKAAFIGWEVLSGERNITFSDTLTIAEQTVTSGKGDASIKAIFSTETIQMTILSNGLGFTKPEGKIYVVKNRWLPINAKPNKGQTFVQWTTVAGSQVQFKDAYSEKTEMKPGTENIVIKALFRTSSPEPGIIDTLVSPIDTSVLLTLGIEFNNAQGVINTANEIILKSGTATTITATPHKGYYFQEWIIKKGSLTFLSSRYSPTIHLALRRENAIIIPVFKEKPLHTLQIIFKDNENKRKTINSSYR